MVNLVLYINEFRELVAQLENEGLTTSDAQGCAETELFKKYGVMEMTLVKQDPIAWIEACEKVGA
jgi:hypothetical protein